MKLLFFALAVTLFLLLLALLLLRGCKKPLQQVTSDDYSVENGNSASDHHSETQGRDQRQPHNQTKASSSESLPTASAPVSTRNPSQNNSSPPKSLSAVLKDSIAGARATGRSDLGRIKRQQDGTAADPYYATLVYSRESLRLLTAIYELSESPDQELIKHSREALGSPASKYDEFLVLKISETMAIASDLSGRIAGEWATDPDSKAALSVARSLLKPDFESKYARLAASLDSMSRSIAVMAIVAQQRGNHPADMSILRKIRSQESAPQLQVIEESLIMMNESLRVGLASLGVSGDRIARVVNLRDRKEPNVQQRFPRIAVEMQCFYEMLCLFLEHLE